VGMTRYREADKLRQHEPGRCSALAEGGKCRNMEGCDGVNRKNQDELASLSMGG